MKTGFKKQEARVIYRSMKKSDNEPGVIPGIFLIRPGAAAKKKMM
jgi:hypothetical protein